MGECKARRHDDTEAQRGWFAAVAVAGFLAATACSGASPDADGRSRSQRGTFAGIGRGPESAAESAAEPAATTPVASPPPAAPTPAMISFVVPVLGAPAPPAAPAPAPVRVPEAPMIGPAPSVAAVEPAVPPGILAISGRIEAVMTDLDHLVDASLELQYSLLRLRLRPKGEAETVNAAAPEAAPETP